MHVSSVPVMGICFLLVIKEKTTCITISFHPRHGDMFLTFKTKYSLGSLLFPSPNGDVSFNHDDDSVVRKTAKVSVPVTGIFFLQV